MEKILTKSLEILALTEEEAYSILNEYKNNNTLESSSIKYKKETKTKSEHWIVCLKIREAIADDYVKI